MGEWWAIWAPKPDNQAQAAQYPSGVHWYIREGWWGLAGHGASGYFSSWGKGLSVRAGQGVLVHPNRNHSFVPGFAENML
jgi:hypothetical protein